MPCAFTTLSEIYTAPFDDVIDVRSPAEFAEDHVPGAISLPVLSNEERAVVGTIYTQDAPFKARKKGAALVARNAAAHIEGPLADRDGGWQPLIYCWRGGQRSGSFASILSQIGWRAEVIEGGYRAYRRLVVAALYEAPLPHPLILIEGYTGTAKTELLGLLAARGAQVLDLEGLAAHRGSLFGARAGGQPAQKGFESALAQALDTLDPTQPVFVEAESSKIGERLLPASLWSAMREAPRVVLTAPLAARAHYLVRTYSDMVEDAGVLADTLDRLLPFQGYARVADWKEMAQAGQFAKLAEELMQFHYDGRYAKARSGQKPKVLAEISLGDLHSDDLARAADQMAALTSP